MIVVKCHSRQCPNTVESQVDNPKLVKDGAMAAGWFFPAPFGFSGASSVFLGYCGPCIRKADQKMADLRPPGDPLTQRAPVACRDCDDTPIAVLLGHDGIGHKVARALARHGYTSVESLRAADPADLRDIPYLGDKALALIKKKLIEHYG